MSTDGTGAATLSDQVIEEILGLMGRRRINKAEMARRLGTKEDWVGRRLNGRQPIDVQDLQRFASTGEAPPGAHIVIRPVYVHHGDEAMGP